jgi:hypothetical protein
METLQTPPTIDIKLTVDGLGRFGGTCVECGAAISDRPLEPKVFRGLAMFHRDQSHPSPELKSVIAGS